MSSDELRRSWNITREHLAQARRELRPQEGASRPLVRDFEEYLEHNELELAMEALAQSGEVGSPTAEFWRALSRAAFEMGLRDRGDHFLRRCV